MKKDLVIIGAGGFAREVAWLVEEINKNKPTWNLLGFLDDYRSPDAELVNGLPVLGNLAWLEANDKCYVVCAIGDPRSRCRVMSRLAGSPKLATLIDPSVKMSRYVDVGAGSIICAVGWTPSSGHRKGAF